MLPPLFDLVYEGQFEELEHHFNSIGQDNLAHVLYLEQQGKYDQALTQLREFEGLQAAILKGRVLWRKGSFDHALMVLHSVDPQTQDLYWQSLWHNIIGNVRWQQGYIDEALDHHQISLGLRQELGYSPLVTLSLNNIGTTYYSNGDNQLALTYFKRALDSVGKKFNPNVKGAIISNIASIYSSLGQLTEALEYNKQGLKLRQELGNPSDVAFSLNNLGVIHYKMGDLDKAMDYHQQAREIKEQLDNPQSLISTYSNLAKVYYSRGELEEASKLLETCIGLSQMANNPLSQANLYFWLIQVDLALNRPVD